MKPGDLRRWLPKHGGGFIVILKIHGRENGYCGYLEGGKIYEWVPVIDVMRESEVVNETG
jgi:hypothetical protein